MKAELGAPPPVELASLDPDQIERLTALLAASRKQQRRALAEALDQGLGFVPRVARGAVKRALFG